MWCNENMKVETMIYKNKKWELVNFTTEQNKWPYMNRFEAYYHITYFKLQLDDYPSCQINTFLLCFH